MNCPRQSACCLESTRSSRKPTPRCRLSTCDAQDLTPPEGGDIAGWGGLETPAGTCPHTWSSSLSWQGWAREGCRPRAGGLLEEGISQIAWI